MTPDALVLTIVFFAISILYMNLNPFAWMERYNEPSFIISQVVRLGIGLLVSFVGYYLFLIAITPIVVIAYHGVCIAIFQFIALFVNLSADNYAKFDGAICAIAGVFLVAVVAVAIFQGAVTCNASYDFVKDYAEETDNLIIVSTSDMNIVTQKTANRDVKLSLSNFDNTSRYTTGGLYKQEINGNKLWVSPVEYSDFFRALGSDKFLPGYVTVDVSTNKEISTVNNMQMIYAPSAIFQNDLYRHIHFKHPDVLLYEAAFELDDEGNAFWIVPYGHYHFLCYFEVVDGVFIVNPTTGEISKYEIENVPNWVNTVIPASIADMYCNIYGENSLGFFAKFFTPSTQFTLTRWVWEGSGDDAWSIVFDENGEMWYCSDTTRYAGSERTMVGYIMMSAKTGQIKYNPDIKGINGNGICQNFKQPYKEKTGWVLAEPTLYVIDNVPTWFSVIVDENGEIQMYCFGTLEGDIATDTNFAKALSQYRTLINSEGSTIVDTDLLQISGTIFRTNVVGEITYIIIDGNKNLVISVPDYISKLAKMTRDGDYVDIKYSLFEGSEAVASSFEVVMK